MTLKDFKVAALMCDGFEEIEFISPRDALREQGAKVVLISPNEMVKSWDHDHWSQVYAADLTLDQAEPNDYDALLLPGGVMNPDKLRMNEKAITFVNHFFEHTKPIAAICHAPWTLIETGKVASRKLTSYRSIKTDLINAGANWLDQEVVVDGQLITSRSPKDLPAFNQQILEQFGQKR